MSSATSPTDDTDSITLFYTRHEKVPAKDFHREIRGSMDVSHLLENGAILLDVRETDLEDIFLTIAQEMNIREPGFHVQHVLDVLFTGDEKRELKILANTLQAIVPSEHGSLDFDQSWISAMCMLPTVQHRHIAIARLYEPTNLGVTMEEVKFIILVVAPSYEKGTKTALETSRTFATLLSDMDLRQKLSFTNDQEEFQKILFTAAKQSEIQNLREAMVIKMEKQSLYRPNWYPFRGVKEEFLRRLELYPSDILDGIRGPKTIQKLLSTTIFLYFACLLPAIALGVLNDGNTEGGINVRKVILGQAVGGIFFSLFGGQPLVILITTAPLAIYIKIIYTIAQQMGYDFFAMYASVGLFCQLLLILYSATELGVLMKFSTRSAEEMFSLFIAIALTVESGKAIYSVFLHNYAPCGHQNDANFTNNFLQDCNRDTAILFILLMLGTLWLGMFLYNFRKTPFLTRGKRELLADYALPVAVIVMSFAGSVLFSGVVTETFNLRLETSLTMLVDITSLPPTGFLLAFLLSIPLSVLFFIDQNISAAIVNNPQNKLKKGQSDNFDLFVVAILNSVLSLLGLPWMHGGLPHSPLHVRALADVEQHVTQGHVYEIITNVRETRLAALIAHIFILITAFFLIPYPLQLIPTSVLYGLFLYMAVTSLSGNELFERVLLIITEQQAYPPNHYIRRVPQRKVHLFTLCQLLQLGILCVFGFTPYPFVKMAFPVVFVIFLPIRTLLLPHLINKKYLEALDHYH